MSRKINRAKRAICIPKNIGTCSAKGPDIFRKRALCKCFSDELHVQECQKDEKSRIFSAKEPYIFCKRAVYIPHKSPPSRVYSSKEKEPYLFCKKSHTYSAKEPYMFCKRAVYLPHKSPTSRIYFSKEKELYLFCKRALRKCFSDALASHAASDMTHPIAPHMTHSISISHAQLCDKTRSDIKRDLYSHTKETYIHTQKRPIFTHKRDLYSHTQKRPIFTHM